MDPQQNQAPQNFTEVKKKSFGPIVGIIIIVVLIVIAALYYWGQGMSQVYTNGTETLPTQETANTPTIPQVSASDELDAINQDLNAGSGADVNFDTSVIDMELE